MPLESDQVYAKETARAPLRRSLRSLGLGPRAPACSVGTPLCPYGIAYLRNLPMSLWCCLPQAPPYVPTVLLTVGTSLCPYGIAYCRDHALSKAPAPMREPLKCGAWSPAETLHPKPETLHPKPEIRSPKPEARNSRPETRSLKPEARNPKPEIRNPQPEIRNPKPET